MTRWLASQGKDGNPPSPFLFPSNHARRCHPERARGPRASEGPACGRRRKEGVRGTRASEGPASSPLSTSWRGGQGVRTHGRRRTRGEDLEGGRLLLDSVIH